ncbi:LysR family transcriptional regulator [Salininema proteolyticum]|uniref:LysR family transcriptional regulator n=1 Tax=Salininema proteolyticum TaxID=1607685 RepID=A0ABV8U078_9ACTN
MERHEIEIFLALAEELHFGKAAGRAGVSPSRVSQVIRGLEERLGAPLFTRTSRRVSLTALGDELRADLAPAWADVLSAWEKASASARPPVREIRVGYLGQLTAGLLTSAKAAYTRVRPDVRIRLTETHIGDPVRPLREGAVDLLLTETPVEEPGVSVAEAILSEPRVLAVPRGHRFSDRESVHLDELAGESTFALDGEPPEYWERSCVLRETPSGEKVGHAFGVSSFGEALAMVGVGTVIGLVPEHASQFHARPDVVYVSVIDAPVIEYAFAWKENAPNSDGTEFGAFVSA